VLFGQAGLFFAAHKIPPASKYILYIIPDLGVNVNHGIIPFSVYGKRGGCLGSRFLLGIMMNYCSSSLFLRGANRARAQMPKHRVLMAAMVPMPGTGKSKIEKSGKYTLLYI
jgi:hypothetical protein